MAFHALLTVSKRLQPLAAAALLLMAGQVVLASCTPETALVGAMRVSLAR